MAMKRTIDFHLSQQRKKADLYQSIKTDLEDDFSTDEESANLSTNLVPLSHYVNDPEQLIHQLFSVVRGKRLARLIPPELKELSFEELKTDCLVQLLCMSKKRVLATLEGREMESSSDTDDSIDDKKKQLLKSETKNETVTKRSHKERKIKSKKKKLDKESESEQEKPEEKEGKTLLEILELEMKAKAIRALLGSNQKDNNYQIEEAIKNEMTPKKTDEKSSDDKIGNDQYEERENVKEVVRTSRLCTNMRRRMLLHQQKMLADRAKAKGEEAENINSEEIIKSKLKESLQNTYFQVNEEHLNINASEEKPNTINDTSEDNKDIVCPDNKLQTGSNVHGNDVPMENTNATSSSEVVANTQESTDDDSQKSTDFERVLSEYTQKNTALEISINEYSQQNTDLQEEINTCTKKNDDMENIMNTCAQKNSDIESAIKNYSVENKDRVITIDNEEDSDLNTAIEKNSKINTDLDLLINDYSKKNVDLKAIIKDYSQRNFDIMTLMGEYSQNNINIQSVIGDYAEGNHKLETIIDEYSHRNSKINTMINEYSVNNTNLGKIIDRNNKKQLLINKYNVESAVGKAVVIDNIKENNEVIDNICESKD